MRRHRTVRLPLLLAAAAILLAGCDSSGPTDPLGGVSPRAGEWVGTTDQEKSISFSVGGAASAPLLTRYEVSIRIDELEPGSGCLGSETTVSLEPARVPIVDGAFAFEIQSFGETIRFEGRFDSAVSASGRLSAETTPGSTCPGRGRTNWTAQPA